ncbi:MAG: agmatine deiminase family protein [Bacilli bacterium]|nr:agmatine deiminase family protein [Bacilli bacterium]
MTKALLSIMSMTLLLLSSCGNKGTSKKDEPVSPSDPVTPVDPDDPDDPDDPETYKVIETFAKRMPGEFEPCAMVKVVYPNMFPLEGYKIIAEDNPLLVLVNPNSNGKSRITSARSDFNEAGINVDEVTFIDMPIDDDYSAWVRDFSPFYVFDNLDLSIVDFTYNRPRYEQNVVPNKLATYFDIPYRKMNLVHTGGNLMQDGRGTAFSDDLVVYENDNNETNVRNLMKEYTGTDNYVITIDPQGDYIAHIDCWGKIIAPDKIVVAKMPKSNSRYSYYEEVAEKLGNTKCAYGYNYKIYRLEEPGGYTVAPYTNALIANNHVYMPLGENDTYNEKALEVYREALPGYEVIGIEGYESDYYQREFLNTDALHCRTHEVPDQNMLFIDSREVYHDTVELKEKYLIKANLVSYAKGEIKSAKVHYSINDGAYQEADMEQYEDTTNYTYSLENLSSGDDIKYYITAEDSLSNTSVDPTCGNLDPHHFIIN